MVAYRIDVGRFLSGDQGQKALVERPGGETKWSGPYPAKALPARFMGLPGPPVNKGRDDGGSASAPVMPPTPAKR